MMGRQVINTLFLSTVDTSKGSAIRVTVIKLAFFYVDIRTLLGFRKYNVHFSHYLGTALRHFCEKPNKNVH